MPLFDFTCNCGYTEERLVGLYDPNPTCPKCNGGMVKKPPTNVMVKMKGEGGYPSRKKQIFNTTFRKHPSLT